MDSVQFISDLKPDLFLAFKSARMNATCATAADVLKTARRLLAAYKDSVARWEDAGAILDHARASGESPRAVRRAMHHREESARRMYAAKLAALPVPKAARRAARLDHADVIRGRDATGRRRTFVIAHVPDSDMGAPWEEHDGHGPVERVSGGKRPGQILFGEGWAYDMQAACALARKDGWGHLPGPLEIRTEDSGRRPYERRGGWAICRALGLAAYHAADVNKAVAAVYARHRASMTPRAYAAAAAQADFERCRRWAADQWQWCGVALVELPRDQYTCPESVADSMFSGPPSAHGKGARVAASLWGIESDSPEYLSDVARELLPESMAACD